MNKITVSDVYIEDLVYIIRNQKVMLDSDLALIYGVNTKRLNEQVKRNIARFPEEFMFQLSEDEVETLKSQIATSNKEAVLKSQNATSKRGGRRSLPFVFTEHGSVMLASVLNSPQAITASIKVVKVFVRLREILSTHKELAKKVEALEQKYDKNFSDVFAALRELMGTHFEKKERLILRKGIKD